MKTQLFIVAIVLCSLFIHGSTKAEEVKALKLSQHDLQSIGFIFHPNKIVYKTLFSGKKIKFKITKKGVTNHIALADQKQAHKNCCPILVKDSKQLVRCCMQVAVDKDLLVLPILIESENKAIEQTLFCFVYTDTLQEKLRSRDLSTYLVPYDKVSGCKYETAIDNQQLAFMLNLDGE